MASDTTAAASAPEEAGAVEYESDPDEVKHLLVMRRREASDDEDEERQSGRRRDSRVHILSDYESDEGGAPAEYDDDEEEEEHEGDLEEEDEEGEVYEDEEEEEGYQEEEMNDREVRVKGVEGIDEERSTEGIGKLSAGNNVNGDNDEENDVVEEGKEEEKKEISEPFAVPTAGAFYMHDDRFRDNVGGRHRRTHGGRRLWESKDDRKWGHDKFEELTFHERHFEEGRRTSIGRYRGRGKTRGSDQLYPRGRRSKAFNNNSTRHEAPKAVRGRGSRRSEPTWKNSNQAPPPQNKQSGKPLEKTSHFNSGRGFTPTSNSESDTAATRKQVFASSLSSASPPFYPSGSSNKDTTLPQKRDVQSGSTSRNLQNSGIDRSFSLQHANAMHRGKRIVDVNMDKLYINDSSALSAVKTLKNSLQMPPQLRAQGRGVPVSQQTANQPAAPQNKHNRASSTQLQAVQRSSSQSRIPPARLATLRFDPASASGSQTSSTPKAASTINSNDYGEVDSSAESSKLKSALLGKGKGSKGRGSIMYSGSQVMGAAGNVSVGHGDQNFPAFLPVMQFGGQHPRGIGVPAVGMAFPGYVGQPQLGVGNSEMTWLPVLAGAAGALGATYCPPYIAVDGAYNARPAGQTSLMGSSSKESNINKPGSEWKPSQRPDSGSDDYAQQQNKPQPRRYSAMNLANDVLR